ncbi:hypothetical protein M5K25_027656 [Dendrobium thyrsiflorum]|uniref:Uncharacterized protein n=1 Tax=Dendrobium thyrsiflorum TaxID=117978 RepID=A0ABD0TUB7_DENTH
MLLFSFHQEIIGEEWGDLEGDEEEDEEEGLPLSIILTQENHSKKEARVRLGPARACDLQKTRLAPAAWDGRLGQAAASGFPGLGQARDKRGANDWERGSGSWNAADRVIPVERIIDKQRRSEDQGPTMVSSEAEATYERFSAIVSLVKVWKWSVTEQRSDCDRRQSKGMATITSILLSQMAGGKRSRQEKGSSSRSNVNPCFINAEDQAAYNRYKLVGLTYSKIINFRTLSYPVLDLFAHTSLTFILTLACPYNVELLCQLFPSLRINSTYTSLQSYVNKRHVELTYQDFEEILKLSTTGDKLHNIVSDPDYNWSQANHFLRNTAAPFHDGTSSSLGKDARNIQHVLRSSIIPKAGYRIHITPLLSLTTFYIMAHREFNASDLIFRYIEHLTTIRDAGHRRKLNLALGHIISYALEMKYNL